MADSPSDQTIKQMMAGFSAMQYNLGLLPMQTSQALAGSFQGMTPPPPAVPHPSEAAMAAMAAQQTLMQQTLAAAQMTRYQPPPSAPMPAVSAMSPYSAPMGFGGGYGGGFGGYPSMGPPAGFSGGATNVLGAGYGPPVRLPSIFNPFAPALPMGHFASPSMRSLQVMYAGQSQMMGAAAGIGEAGLGIGGSLLGGALGGLMGPLGSIAGSWLGGKVGGALSSMIFNPVVQDFSRGRQIQAMTAPFMVTGANLNMMTGQGLDPRASRDVATGVRLLQRDFDFERTGFNTQDTLRIMQSSANHGLLTGSQNPDQIVQKVKDIAKTVKVLMRITGDPDVRDAIQSLGQMRDMGFMGLAAQAGAVANRASFARMAGMSQQQMMGVMQGGAAMAGQYGLVGATGMSASGFGAAAANVAASSGALNELQLARAGGVGGLGQINARGSLAAMQNDQYLLAAMGRDSHGRMTVDLDAYRRVQHMGFGEVQQRAADALRSMGPQGIFEWNTRRQEMKDQLAQHLRPGEMQMNMLNQARAFQRTVPGMSLGTALQQTTGMSAEEARALEAQFNSRQYWQGLANQLRVQRRDVVDQERARREMYRTPGLMTRMGQGARVTLGSISDAISSPFRSIGEHFDRVAQEDEAAARGDRISYYGDADIARDDAERAMLRRSLSEHSLRTGGSSNFVGAMGTGGLRGAFGRSTGREINRIGSFLGLSSDSSANRLAAIADYSRGRYTHFGETFGDPRAALARVRDVGQVAQALSTGPLTGDQSGTLYRNLANAGGPGKQNASAILGAAKDNMLRAMKGMKAGYFKSARAMAGSDMRSFFIQAATHNGMTQAEASRAWEANKEGLMKEMSNAVYDSGDQKLIEVFEKAQEVQTRVGSVDLASGQEAAESQISDELKKSGVGDVGEKTMAEVKAIVAHHDDNLTIQLATIERAATSGGKVEKAQARKLRAALERQYGAEAIGKHMTEAHSLARSMSSDTADAFERTLVGTDTVQQFNDKLDQVRKAAAGKMELAARREFKQKLDSVHKGAAGASSVEAAVGMLTEDEIDKLDSSTKDAVLKYRNKGDKGALYDAIAKSAPSTHQTRHSDAASDKLRELDQQIADYEDEAAKASDSGTPEAVQGKAAELFAGAVKDFVDAVKDLKGHSDDQRLDWLSPFVQSKIGGS